jgi:hypothetical protein
MSTSLGSFPQVAVAVAVAAAAGPSTASCREITRRATERMRLRFSAV